MHFSASVPGAKYELPKFGHGLFLLFLSPSSLAFPAPFFSFVGHLLGFILEGKFFGIAFRIIGLDGRKCRRVVEQDFHRNFGSTFHGFFLPFSPASLTKSCSFWYGLKDLFTLHK